MLVLSRRIDERLIIGDDIIVQVVDVQGKQVVIGITAPQDVQVDREEVRLRKMKEETLKSRD